MGPELSQMGQGRIGASSHKYEFSPNESQSSNCTSSPLWTRLRVRRPAVMLRESSRLLGYSAIESCIGVLTIEQRGTSARGAPALLSGSAEAWSSTCSRCISTCSGCISACSDCVSTCSSSTGFTDPSDDLDAAADPPEPLRTVGRALLALDCDDFSGLAVKRIARNASSRADASRVTPDFGSLRRSCRATPHDSHAVSRLLSCGKLARLRPAGTEGACLTPVAQGACLTPADALTRYPLRAACHCSRDASAHLCANSTSADSR